MTAIYNRFGVDSLGELFMRGVRAAWPREGLLTLVLLLFLYLTAVWSVEAAGWVDRLPALGAICLAATAMGFLFAKTHLRWYWVHPVALLYGFVVTMWQTTSLIDNSELHIRIVDLIIRLNAWGYAARTGGFNTDPLVFVYWLAVLTWITCYFSTWWVFRAHRIWWGILPTGVALLMNLRYAPPQATIWFFFYLVFALLLLVRFNVFKQHEAWRSSKVDFSPSIGFSSLPELTAYALLITTMVYFSPSGGIAPLVGDIWNAVTGPYNDMSIEFNRLFANLNTTAEGPATTFSRSLVLKGPIKLGTSVIMYVQTDEPVYLRATAYDVHTAKGFVTGDKLTINFPPGNDVPAATSEFKARKELTQKVTLRATPGNAILAAGIPLRSSQRAVAEIDKPLSYPFSLDDTSTDTSLPADIRSAAPAIRDSFVKLRTENKLGSSPLELLPDVYRAFPTDVRVASYLNRDGKVVGLELQRISTYLPDVTSVRVPGRGRAPGQYTVVSSVSNASELELRRSSINYPGLISDRYLQLSPSLPERIRRLARQLTDDANNPYDKAMKIQDYLRTFKYNESIEPPPPNTDALENFLFNTKEGYCDYFSTAMVVMLRSLGVPARIAAGYYTGEFDSNKGYYLVRESNTHAWPEVYFADYGWIEFEPTPSRPAIARIAGSDETDSTNGGPSTTSSDGVVEDPGLIEDPFSVDIGGGISDENTFPIVPVALVGAVIAAGLGGWYTWRRALRGLSGASLAYEQVRKLASIGFRPQRDAETPNEYGRSLGEVLPGKTRSIGQVMSGYTTSRYSRNGLDRGQTNSLKRAWQDLRTSLVVLALKKPLGWVTGTRRKKAKKFR